MSCPVHLKTHYGVTMMAQHPHLALEDACTCHMLRARQRKQQQKQQQKLQTRRLKKIKKQDFIRRYRDFDVGRLEGIMYTERDKFVTPIGISW